MLRKEKVRLTAYEFISLMGACEDPCLSQGVKDALDRELAKAEYVGLDPGQVFWKASRRISLNEPEVFDLSNRDDVMMKKLVPLMFRENGERVPFSELMEHIQFDNVTVASHDKGSKFDFTLTARDPGEPPRVVRYSAPAKDPNRKPGAC